MKVRRKIMALGTALAMAFVMIASLVLVTDVKAESNKVTSINATVKVPDVGDTINKKTEGEEPWTYDVQDPKPTITVSTEGIQAEGYWTTGDHIYTVDGDESPMFYGTFEEGKEYYIMIDFFGDEIPNLSTDQVLINGEPVHKVGLSSGSELQCIFKFTPGGDEPSPTPDPDTPSSDVPTISDGSTVEVAPAEDGTVTFRFEKDLEYFENGGQLFIDGQPVPTNMYKATRGSTIITLFKEYAAKLADGAEHAVKVVFNDNTSVEGKIVVKAASSDSSASTAASGTSGTASSTAATTTKVTSPKTADVLPIAGIALVFVGATAIGVIAYRRKNS